MFSRRCVKPMSRMAYPHYRSRSRVGRRAPNVGLMLACPGTQYARLTQYSPHITRITLKEIFSQRPHLDYTVVNNYYCVIIIDCKRFMHISVEMASVADWKAFHPLKSKDLLRYFNPCFPCYPWTKDSNGCEGFPGDPGTVSKAESQSVTGNSVVKSLSCS